jgi:hypothetical protein
MFEYHPTQAPKKERPFLPRINDRGILASLGESYLLASFHSLVAPVPGTYVVSETGAIIKCYYTSMQINGIVPLRSSL